MGFPRTLAALALFQAESAAYFAVNRFPTPRRAVRLATPADARVPFQPTSLWLYLSFVPYCLSSVYDFRTFGRLLRMMACLVLSSLVCYRSFLLFPARFPRPPVDVPDPRLARAWRALRAADGPGNTFPSIHVGHALLLALMLARELPEEDARARLLWALLLSLSTLTAKQHFAVDVAGGVLVAETVATQVFEPWTDGRLSLRSAWREIRLLCRRLDALAREPAACRLPAADRHPLLRALLLDCDRAGSLSALCARAPGRAGLLERQRLLAGRLRRARLAVGTAVALAPEWLQFLRLLEEEAPRLTEERILDHVAGLDVALGGALRELVAFPGDAAAAVASGDEAPGHVPDEWRHEVHEAGHAEPAGVPLAGMP